MPPASAYSDLPVYLTVLDVTINTFIPENNYPDPRVGWWPGVTGTGEGDNRSWDRYGSSRTYHQVSIYQPYLVSDNLFESTQIAQAGFSAYYEMSTSLDGSGNLTDEARNDWTEGAPMKVAWGAPDGSSLNCDAHKTSHSVASLECHGNEATPLFWWAPGITYDFFIDFTFNDDTSVDFLITGDHDGFPNCEIYVGDQLLAAYRPSRLWSEHMVLGTTCGVRWPLHSRRNPMIFETLLWGVTTIAQVVGSSTVPVQPDDVSLRQSAVREAARAPKSEGCAATLAAGLVDVDARVRFTSVSVLAEVPHRSRRGAVRYCRYSLGRPRVGPCPDWCLAGRRCSRAWGGNRRVDADQSGCSERLTRSGAIR